MFRVARWCASEMRGVARAQPMDCGASSSDHASGGAERASDVGTPVKALEISIVPVKQPHVPTEAPLRATDVGSWASARPATPAHATNVDSMMVSTLYLIFGLGSGWTLTDALMIEVARMSQTQPEGLSLATILTTAGTIGSTVVVPSFHFLQRWLQWPLERWVWVGLGCQAMSAIIGVIGWHATVGGTSPALYMVGFLASYGGNFQQLAVLPWVQAGGTHPSAVSWTMAGSNFGAVVCAIFGSIQHPGSPNMRFSVSLFFVMVLALIVLAVCAFVILIRRQRRACSTGAQPTAPASAAACTSSRQQSKEREELVRRHRKRGRCLRSSLPWFSLHPHVRRVAATNATLQLVCWIFLRSLLPFAAAHASGGGTREGAQQAHEKGDAGVLQGYAVEISLIAVFIGAVLSAYVPNHQLRLTPALVAMIGPLTIICAMCFGWQPFGSVPGAQAILLFAVALARFTDGIATPLCYRVSGDPFPESERQVVTQWVGIVAIIVAAAGTWVALILVVSGVIQ